MFEHSCHDTLFSCLLHDFVRLLLDFHHLSAPTCICGPNQRWCLEYPSIISLSSPFFLFVQWGQDISDPMAWTVEVQVEIMHSSCFTMVCATPMTSCLGGTCPPPCPATDMTSCAQGNAIAPSHRSLSRSHTFWTRKRIWPWQTQQQQSLTLMPMTMAPTLVLVDDFEFNISYRAVAYPSWQGHKTCAARAPVAAAAGVSVGASRLRVPPPTRA